MLQNTGSFDQSLAIISAPISLQNVVVVTSCHLISFTTVNSYVQNRIKQCEKDKSV